MKFLLDTCVLSEFCKPEPTKQVLSWIEGQQEASLAISAISLAEIYRGVGQMPDSKRQLQLKQWAEGLETYFEGRILAFDRTTARVWSELTAPLKKQGIAIPLADSLIAASASQYSLTVVTRNVADFQHTGLRIVNPWDVN